MEPSNNVTNSSVLLEEFPTYEDYEEEVENVTSPAPDLQSDLNLQSQRLTSSEPKVTIHNIISGLPKPEIEMLYTVYQGTIWATYEGRICIFVYFPDNQPIPAKQAVAALDEVENNDVENMLGFPLVTKAEPYVPRASPYTDRHPVENAGHTSLLIAAVIISAFLVILVLIALMFLMKKNGASGLKHRKLMGTPTSATSGPTNSQGASQGQTSLAGSVRIN